MPEHEGTYLDRLFRSGSEDDDRCLSKCMDIVVENRRAADARYLRSFYSLLVLSTTVWLIHLGAVKKTAPGSVEVDPEVVCWIIPPIMAFILYNGLVNLMAASNLRDMVHSYIRTCCQEAYAAKVHLALAPPTFLNIERWLHERREPGASALFAGLMVVFLLYVPFVLVACAALSSLWLEARSVKWYWQLVLLIASAVFWARAWAVRRGMGEHPPEMPNGE